MEPNPTSSSVQAAASRASIQALRQQSTSSSNSAPGNNSSSTSTGAISGSGNRNGSVTPTGTAISVFFQELTSTTATRQQQHQQQQQEQQATPTSSSASSSNNHHNNQEQNRCYICFGTDEDSVGRWVKPCQCTLISHEDCLLDWIDKNRQQFAKKQVRKKASGCLLCLVQKSMSWAQWNGTLQIIDTRMAFCCVFYFTFR